MWLVIQTNPQAKRKKQSSCFVILLSYFEALVIKELPAEDHGPVTARHHGPVTARRWARYGTHSVVKHPSRPMTFDDDDASRGSTACLEK